MDAMPGSYAWRDAGVNGILLGMKLSLYIPCRYNPNGMDSKPTLKNAVVQNSAVRNDFVSWW